MHMYYRLPHNIIQWHYLLILGITLLFFYISIPVGIFWDNVLFVGKTGTALLENGLLNWFSLPISSYTAHPHLCGTYYATIWYIFGRSLLISHIATIPIIIGVLYQLWKLCTFFIDSLKQRYAAFIILCANPILCSHCVQIGQELFILFFALYTLNAILHQNHIQKAIALCILPLFSLRAMMLCAGLFLTEWALCACRSERFWSLKMIFSYLGGASISIIYLLLRYKIFSNAPQTMHTGYFDYSSITQILYSFLRNCAILVWEYCDFGQISLYIVSFILILYHRDKIKHQLSQIKELLICAVLPCSIIILTSLISLNPFGHHYFLLSFLACILTSFYLLQYSSNRKWLYALLLLSLLSGNFIVYPEYKAQGWNNSLAHLPYWSIRRQAIQQMDERNIPLENTATFFPNQCENDCIELNGDHRSFCKFTGSEEYVFYSSCFNPYDDEITLLHNTYEPLFKYKKGFVWVQVLQRKQPNP